MPPDPTPSTPEAPPPAGPALLPRVVALLEVLICSDFPTQLALGSTFAAFGYRPYNRAGQLLIGYVAALSLVDSALLVALMLAFLAAHGERPRDIFFGRRPIRLEALAGLPLILIALAVGLGLLLTLERFAPSLHTVAENPLEELLRTPGDVWRFGVVVVVAGAVREELQRAFILCRFERWLGGGAIGVVVASAAFGAGHLLQGADAAIATGVLGAFWGIVYLRRRSVVAPMVSHAGFNLLQILQYLVFGS